MPPTSNQTFEDIDQPPDNEAYMVEDQPGTEIQVITILKTDGRPVKWPDSGQGGVYVDASANDKRTQWLRFLGRFIGEHLKKHAGSIIRNPMQCILADFPKHYELKLHMKGDRVDAYLRGSQHVHQFRSPHEFALHVRWLIAGRPLRGADLKPQCCCTYCSKVPQSAISKTIFNRKMGIHLHSHLDTFDDELLSRGDDNSGTNGVSTQTDTNQFSLDPKMALHPVVRPTRQPKLHAPRLVNDDGQTVKDPVLERRKISIGLHKGPRMLHNRGGAIWTESGSRRRGRKAPKFNFAPAHNVLGEPPVGLVRLGRHDVR